MGIIGNPVKVIVSFLLLYAFFLILALYQIIQQENFPQPKEHVVYQDIYKDKSNIVAAIVDQLKENNKGYSKNVWTTLATIVLALGMVLGSDRFQKILRTGRTAVYAIQIALVMLYVLHACAYYSHLKESISLFDKLKFLIEPMEYYYAGYSIDSSSVIINLVFDTFLFVILACIIEYVGTRKKNRN